MPTVSDLPAYLSASNINLLLPLASPSVLRGAGNGTAYATDLTQLYARSAGTSSALTVTPAAFSLTRQLPQLPITSLLITLVG